MSLSSWFRVRLSCMMEMNVCRYAKNLVLKINAKLGGVNFALDPSAPLDAASWMPWPFRCEAKLG